MKNKYKKKEAIMSKDKEKIEEDVQEKIQERPIEKTVKQKGKMYNVIQFCDIENLSSGEKRGFIVFAKKKGYSQKSNSLEAWRVYFEELKKSSIK